MAVPIVRSGSTASPRESSTRVTRCNSERRYSTISYLISCYPTRTNHLSSTLLLSTYHPSSTPHPVSPLRTNSRHFPPAARLTRPWPPTGPIDANAEPPGSDAHTHKPTVRSGHQEKKQNKANPNQYETGYRLKPDSLKATVI